jgi:lipoyl-dependent peroxiredoxin
MAARTANALWEGSINEGSGRMALGSGAFEGNYSFQSRFGDAPGTTPEELLAAAHAGCFTMAMSLYLGEQGHDPESVTTQAKVQMRQTDQGPTITRIDLVTRGRVPGMDDAGFKEAAENAKETCVVSRALAGVPEMTVDAALEEG